MTKAKHDNHYTTKAASSGSALGIYLFLRQFLSVQLVTQQKLGESRSIAE